MRTPILKNTALFLCMGILGFYGYISYHSKSFFDLSTAFRSPAHSDTDTVNLSCEGKTQLSTSSDTCEYSIKPIEEGSKSCELKARFYGNNIEPKTLPCGDTASYKAHLVEQIKTLCDGNAEIKSACNGEVKEQAPEEVVVDFSNSQQIDEQDDQVEQQNDDGIARIPNPNTSRANSPELDSDSDLENEDLIADINERLNDLADKCVDPDYQKKINKITRSRSVEKALDADEERSYISNRTQEKLEELTSLLLLEDQKILLDDSTPAGRITCAFSKAESEQEKLANEGLVLDALRDDIGTDKTLSLDTENALSSSAVPESIKRRAGIDAVIGIYFAQASILTEEISACSTLPAELKSTCTSTVASKTQELNKLDLELNSYMQSQMRQGMTAAAANSYDYWKSFYGSINQPQQLTGQPLEPGANTEKNPTSLTPIPTSTNSPSDNSFKNLLNSVLDPRLRQALENNKRVTSGAGKSRSGVFKTDSFVPAYGSQKSSSIDNGPLR